MVVEDGTGLIDANSYVDIAYADDYFSTRGQTEWVDLETSQKEILLVKATDYIDSAFKWKGTKKSNEQGLNFPRINLVNDDGFTVKNVPLALKKAVLECAYLIKDGTELFQSTNENGAVTSEHIGSLSFTYDISQKVKDTTLYESINLRLRGLYEDTTKTRIYTGNVQRI